MEKELRQTLLLMALGILLSLLFFEFAYKQPRYWAEVAFAEFELITSEGIVLGEANSSIRVRYEPVDTSKLGHFMVVIVTEVSIPHQLTSIYSKDLNYEVTFLWKGKSVAGWEGSYLGSSSLVGADTLYNSRTFPSLTQPMQEVQSKKGLVSLVISGTYYNFTNGRVLATGETTIDIFVLPPFAKTGTFTLIFSIICLWYAYVNCICPSCGKQVQSLRIYRCSQFRCPKCGEYMLSEK